MFDYHIHSGFLRHTKDTLDEIVIAAIRLGYDEIAITEHFSYPFAKKTFSRWNLNYDTLIIDSKLDKRMSLTVYLRNLDRIKDKYKNKINILKGLEVDFFPDYEKDIKECLKEYDFDIILGSCHYLPDPLNKGKYLHICSPRMEMLKNNPGERWIYKNYFENVLKSVSSGIFDYIAHLDFLKKKLPEYNQVKAWKDIEKILKAMIKKSVGLEINIRGIIDLNDAYPSKEIIQKYFELGGNKINLGSDSHSVKDIFESRDIIKEFIELYKLSPIIKKDTV
ncbi:MAG: histidinol-phosphatase [Candidatus Aenigmarchaeota archaeon]|nr:histidinol-phosphatase [Candidatus Aenigmarchaeota archaeon]